MRRFVLLTYICLGLTVVFSAGCHKWHHKHFTRACCNVCEPCGNGESVSGVVEGMPMPSTVILPGPPAKAFPACAVDRQPPNAWRPNLDAAGLNSRSGFAS